MVAVHPPLVAYLRQERADQLADAGLFADDPSGMAIAWPRLGGMWATTVERAACKALRGVRASAGACQGARTVWVGESGVMVRSAVLLMVRSLTARSLCSSEPPGGRCPM
jgi:hypothetical protein